MSTTEQRRTPLYDKHVEYGAKIVDFHGWMMPIQYQSILEEHKHTRTKVSVFDVSHMGEFIVKGKQAVDFLNYVNPKNIAKLQKGQVAYSCLLNEKGTVLDDITIYRIGDEECMLCVNASNEEKDFAWLVQHAKNFDVELKNISEHIALLAIQGPDALPLMKKILGNEVENIAYYHFKEIQFKEKRSFLARMGYTGEDGFEFFIPKDLGPTLWDTLFEHGKDFPLKPAGLGARDTLRLEMCFPLYGNDLDEEHNAIESKLTWVIDFDKPDFIGKKALEDIQTKGGGRKFVAFKIEEKGGIPRQGYAIADAKNNTIGVVTSGAISPSLQYGIGMGYVESSLAFTGNKIFIAIRQKFFEAEIIKPPFLKTTRKK